MNIKFFSLAIVLFAGLSITACKNSSSRNKLDNEETIGCGDYEMMKTSTLTIGDLIGETKSTRAIYDFLCAELDSTEIYDDSILYGYWFKPHEASAVNIFFHKNGRFEFKYYTVENDTSIIDAVKIGSFTIGEANKKKTRMIKLKADNGWDKSFDSIIYYKNNGTNFYLTDKKEKMYLVKGSD